MQAHGTCTPRRKLAAVLIGKNEMEFLFCSNDGVGARIGEGNTLVLDQNSYNDGKMSFEIAWCF